MEISKINPRGLYILNRIAITTRCGILQNERKKVRIMEKENQFGIDIEELKSRIRTKLHIGDIVTIPAELMETAEDKKATVTGLTDNLVLFQLTTGRRTSFAYFDCLRISVDTGSDFEVNNDAMLRNDLTRTKRKRKTRK